MKVLFIGNSHTYFNDMPALFKAFAAQKGLEAQVTMLTKGGMGLDYHLKQEQTLFNIRYGEYDYVVLQHTAHPMGDLTAMQEAARALVRIIREAGSTPVFYQTWAQKGDEAYQPIMSGVYADLGKEMNVPVAPVGDEWQKYRLAHPEADLYWKDGAHASPEGSALAARVILSAILRIKA